MVTCPSLSLDTASRDKAATPSQGAHPLVSAPRAQATTIILDGVKADRWRTLVGLDAERLDELVRQSPERAYDIDFFESFAREVGWRVGP
jgi:hypothetical protein